MQFKTHFYIYYEFLLAYTLLNQAKYYERSSNTKFSISLYMESVKKSLSFRKWNSMYQHHREIYFTMNDLTLISVKFQ